MRSLKLTVAYDGTDLAGWQRQKNAQSVQALLEEALARIDGRQVIVAGAGRTDAGVHATGQVASAEVRTALEAETIQRALNAHLPPSIRVRGVEDMPPGFHARFSASGKTYRYLVLLGPYAGPFAYRYAWALAGDLDTAAMARAARLVEGTHDFTAFRAAGSRVRDSVRTVTRSTVTVGDPGSWPGPAGATALARAAGPESGRLLVYEVSGNGFLRHMVRAIVGTLVEVGRGRLTVAGFRDVIERRDRAAAGPTAPAAGLWLVSVGYAPVVAAPKRQPLK